MDSNSWYSILVPAIAGSKRPGLQHLEGGSLRPALRIPQFHSGADAVHRPCRNRARLARSLVQDLSERRGLREQLGAALAHGREVRVQRLRELRLHLDVADLPDPVARL